MIEDATENTSPSLTVDIFTLFPQMFDGPFGTSILSKSVSAGLIEIQLHNIRDWTLDRHRTVDDRPYGGGAGMVLMAPPIVQAVESVLGESRQPSRVLLMSPGGVRFSQQYARGLAESQRIAIICGHYEGVDERVVQILQAEEISIGDFVLTGGELAAMVVVDAVARLVPGVISEESISEESHLAGGIEYPHYTRPAEYRGLPVPDVLVSGHHQRVREWRQSAADEKQRRRDEREMHERGGERVAGR